MESRLSPGSGGPLVDPDGRSWTLARRRLDIRVVRRAFRNADRRLLLGESGGFELRWVDSDERADLWQKIRTNYAGPGGRHFGDVTGHEFVDADGYGLVYVEVSC